MQLQPHTNLSLCCNFSRLLITSSILTDFVAGKKNSEIKENMGTEFNECDEQVSAFVTAK
jgi:hypothetical protein